MFTEGKKLWWPQTASSAGWNGSTDLPRLGSWEFKHLKVRMFDNLVLRAEAPTPQWDRVQDHKIWRSRDSSDLWNQDLPSLESLRLKFVIHGPYLDLDASQSWNLTILSLLVLGTQEITWAKLPVYQWIWFHNFTWKKATGLPASPLW